MIKCVESSLNMLRRYIIILPVFILFVTITVCCQWLQFCLLNIQYGERDVYQEQEIVRQKSSNRARFASLLIDRMSAMWALSSNRSDAVSRHCESEGDMLDLAITIVTTSRHGRHDGDPYQPRYLTQLVAKLLHLMSRKWREPSSRCDLRMKLFICNTDDEPHKHTEAEELVRVVNTWRRFHNGSSGRGAHPQHGPPSLEVPPPASDAMFEKEKQDYVFCLNRTLYSGSSDGGRPRYLLLLQDDALPRDEFLDVLKSVILDHLERTSKRSTARIAWVKLYHPIRLLGFYSLEVERIPELIGLGLFFGTLLAIILIRCFKVSKDYLPIVLSISIVCVMVLSAIVSRQHLIQLRRAILPRTLYWYGPAPDCCMPAMLYPRKAARDIITYLQGVTCRKGYGIDTALDHFIRSQSVYVRRMVQPNIVRHIGMYSTLRGKVLDPSIIDE